jgi:threonine dehydratase
MKAEGAMASELLPGLEEIRAAVGIVRECVPRTPEYRWPQIDARAGRAVWVKHENHSPVGAFKVRGGLVYMEALRRELAAGSVVVLATRGNHGQSMAVAGRRYGFRVVIVVPEGNSPEKNRAMEALGAELVVVGQDFQAATEHAMDLEARNGWHRVPSVHRHLVAGVATGYLELLEAHPEMETLYVPVGMGSGVCAAMAVRDGLGLATEIVGVTSEAARATALSFAAGAVVESEAGTRIADGVACRKPVAVAIEAMCAGVARVVEVSDEAVEEAMRIYFADTHNVAEGAGAVGLAAVLQEGGGGVCGTVLTGGNVDSEVFAGVLRGGRGLVE